MKSRKFKYFKNPHLNRLYVSVGLKHLAGALVDVFIPAYMLTLGYSLRDIAIFYGIFFITLAFANPLALVLNSQWGTKRVFMVGSLSFIAYFALLEHMTIVPYYLVAYVYGISAIFRSSGFNHFLAEFGDKDHEGKQIALIQSIVAAMSVIGPVTGGLVIAVFSFQALFLSAIILLVLSVLVVVRIPTSYPEPPKISWKTIKNADTPLKGCAYALDEYLFIASMIFWPIFIYLLVEEPLALGGLLSLSSFLTVIIINIIGYYSDTKSQKMLFAGIVTHSTSWILRALFLTPVGLFFNNIYSNVTRMMITIPIYKTAFHNAKNSHNRSNYFLFREAYLSLGRLFVVLVVLLTNNLYVLFGSAFIATLLFALVAKKT